MDSKAHYNKPWILQRADPYVLKHTDGYYYFTASVPEYNRIILRRSKSFWGLNEAEECVIWTKHEQGIMSKHIWAPELHYIDGVWYIYFAAGERDDGWKIRPYILACEDENPLTGTWVEKGKMQRVKDDPFSFDAFSLDMTVFENKGKYYCIWAEKVSVGMQISNLYIAQMASPYALKTAQVLLTTPDYDWERVGCWVNEGPFVLKQKGKIYLTFSASDTGSAYCIGLLTADENADLLNPKSWDKKEKPVVRSSEQKHIFGPGHNCFTTDDEGNVLMVYHARDKKEIVGNPLYEPNRHTMVMPIRWDEKGDIQFLIDK